MAQIPSWGRQGHPAYGRKRRNGRSYGVCTSLCPTILMSATLADILPGSTPRKPGSKWNDTRLDELRAAGPILFPRYKVADSDHIVRTARRQIVKRTTPSIRLPAPIFQEPHPQYSIQQSCPLADASNPGAILCFLLHHQFPPSRNPRTACPIWMPRRRSK